MILSADSTYQAEKFDHARGGFDSGFVDGHGYGDLGGLGVEKDEKL